MQKGICRKSAEIMLYEYIFLVDFLFIPLEVKAEENLNAKSLKNFVSASKLPYGVRTSMSDYREQEKLINIPLYAISSLWAVCDRR